jgi:hypothetical protein
VKLALLCSGYRQSRKWWFYQCCTASVKPFLSYFPGNVSPRLW